MSKIRNNLKYVCVFVCVCGDYYCRFKRFMAEFQCGETDITAHSFERVKGQGNENDFERHEEKKKRFLLFRNKKKKTVR